MKERFADESNHMPSAEKDYPVTRIRAAESLFDLDLRDLWDHRELLYFFTWRDLKVRYRQTAVGLSWALLQPFALMLVFTLFFGKAAKMPSEGIPYAVYIYAGLIPWQLFSKTIIEAAPSLINHQRLISKVFFPRILLPTAMGIGAIVDFAASMIVLLFLMLFYGIMPRIELLFLPFFILLTMLSALGIGYWASALNTRYRDIMYLVPLINQIWMFATPVVYPSSLVPEQWKLLYECNPMVGVVEGFRWCLFGVGHAFTLTLLITVLVSFLFFASGLICFRKQERTFADYLA